MPRKLKLVRTAQVIVLGPDNRFNSLHYDRIKQELLTDDQMKRVVGYQACFAWNTKGYCCTHACVWAIVKRNKTELEERKKELKKVFPLTKF
jgi:hypothetical protein